MTTQNTYNGWTNRETWLVNLHFDWMLQDITNDVKEENDKFEVAEILKDSIEDYFKETLENLPPFISDYIDFTLINWIELAENYITED